MKTCPHCGHENSDKQVLCTQCNHLLPFESDSPHADDERAGTTQLLDNLPRGGNVPRWGTASLGTERKLLLHVRGHDTPLVVGLREKLIVGRYDTETSTMPDISFDDFDAAELGVSRRHAMIVAEDDGLKVVDLNSANFTFINGQKLIPHQARILRDGDELRMGRLVVRIGFA